MSGSTPLGPALLSAGTSRALRGAARVAGSDVDMVDADEKVEIPSGVSRVVLSCSRGDAAAAVYDEDEFRLWRL